MTVRRFQRHTPTLGARVMVDDSALVVGEVDLGDDVSIWPTAVLRGDVNAIRVGARSNIQDGSIVHVTHAHERRPQGNPLYIGHDVTVGHRVILHGCTVHDHCLIGMGSVLMDGVVLQPYVLLGAGSLVSEGKELEGGYLWLGSPAKRIRALSAEERAWIGYSADHYVRLKDRYLADLSSQE